MWVGRPGLVLNSLFASALLLTLFDPLILEDAGFQLSFTATLGLIILVPPLERLTFGLLQRWLKTERVGLALALLNELWFGVGVETAGTGVHINLTLYQISNILWVTRLARDWVVIWEIKSRIDRINGFLSSRSKNPALFVFNCVTHNYIKYLLARTQSRPSF